jgi:hypothetical protein
MKRKEKNIYEFTNLLMMKIMCNIFNTTLRMHHFEKFDGLY